MFYKNHKLLKQKSIKNMFLSLIMPKSSRQALTLFNALLSVDAQMF